MSVIIGQKNLLRQIDALMLSGFPRSCILRGPAGSGKHVICRYIAEKLNVSNIFDLEEYLRDSQLKSKSFSVESLKLFMDDCFDIVEDRFIILNGDSITYKEEPVLLKFLEEPPSKVYIVITSSNKLIQTIENRCVRLNIETYSQDELSTFILNKEYEDFLSKLNWSSLFPGKIKTICSYSMEQLNKYIGFSEKIFTSMKNASYPNILSLSENFNFSDKNKFDFNIFLDFLFVSCNKIMQQNDYPWLFQCYEELLNLSYIVKNKSWVNKQAAFENFLLNIKQYQKSVE